MVVLLFLFPNTYKCMANILHANIKYPTNNILGFIGYFKDSKQILRSDI